MRFTTLIGIWFLAALAAGALGLVKRLHPPAPQVVLLALTVTLVTAGAFWPSFRGWLLRLRWQSVVAIHLSRFVGAYFIWLYRRGELPFGFAVPAGIGDLVTAVLATALLLTAPTVSRRPWLLIAWNVVGLADILMVVARAALEGLSDPASMMALVRLPLSLLPTFLVPIIIASHLLLFQKARNIR